MFETSRRNRNTLGYPEDPQTLCATVQNSVVMATWCPENLYIQKMLFVKRNTILMSQNYSIKPSVQYFIEKKISFEFVTL
jgi:hypothetical protein